MGLFPVGHERLARVPTKEMEDTLCEILCSVIPVQHNEKQIWPESGFTPAAVDSEVPSSHVTPTVIHPYLFSLQENVFQILFLSYDCVIFVAVGPSVFCSFHSWLSIVEQPLSHYLPLWTQKNMKSILHAFQAGKFCYWAYCFIMVSIIDIYELWNKT